MALATPAVRSSSSGYGVASGTNTGYYPSSVAEGDLIMLYLAAKTTATSPTYSASGLTYLFKTSTTLYDMGMGFLWKVADGTEGGTSFTFAASKNATEIPHYLMNVISGSACFSGCAYTDWFGDYNGGAATGLSYGTGTLDSTYDNALFMSVGAYGRAGYSSYFLTQNDWTMHKIAAGTGDDDGVSMVSAWDLEETALTTNAAASIRINTTVTRAICDLNIEVYAGEANNRRIFIT